MVMTNPTFAMVHSLISKAHPMPSGVLYDQTRMNDVETQEAQEKAINKHLSDSKRSERSNIYAQDPPSQNESAFENRSIISTVESPTALRFQSSVDHTGLASENTPSIHAPEPFLPCSICANRRGILKKVRFDVDLGPGEEENAREQSTHVALARSSSPFRPVAPSLYDTVPSRTEAGSLQASFVSLPAPPPPPPPPPPIAAPRPPTMFNGALESNEYLNAAAFRLYTDFLDELSGFVTRQGDVTAIRLAVQERRKELSRLREKVSRCDLVLINCMREQSNTSTPSDYHLIQKHFEASQAVRDEIGPVESEYEPLEIHLGSKENQLVKMYSKLEAKFEHFFSLNINPSHTATEPDESSEIEYEASSESLAVDGEAVDGQFDLLHRAVVGEDVGVGQFPRHTGNFKPGSLELRIPGSSYKRSASLASIDFPRFRSSTFTDEIVFVDGAIVELAFIGFWNTEMTDLAETGAIPQHTSADESTVCHSSYIEIPGVLPDLAVNVPVNPGLEEGNPLLLFDESSETRGIFSDYLVNFESTPDRINRWLLHQLRTSPREVYTLRRYIARDSLKSEHWVTSVLREWPHDVFGQPDPNYEDSAEVEQVFENPQLLGYHGACVPGCRDTHDWPENDIWVAHRPIPSGSTFSV